MACIHDVHTSLPPDAKAPQVMRLYTSIAVFLLGAIALIIPSGYSVGALMLLLGSAVLLVKQPALSLSRQDYLVIAAFAAYTSVSLLEAWWGDLGIKGIDKPIRFLFAIPALLLVMVYPPWLSWMWAGLSVGAIGAGTWAGWQRLAEGVERATGYTYVIQFGNISMLLGILCLAGLGWAAVQPRRVAWINFLAMGALFGILGSLFSGSRGGWIGLPFVLLVLYRAYGRELSAMMKAGALMTVIVSAFLVYTIPETGVQSRIHQAFDDIGRYTSGENRNSSVGARFEMWKGASQLIMERPLVGWGKNGYQAGMQALADKGIIDPGVTRFDHAHNEFIDAQAKRGILGLVVLLALYLVSMRYFFRYLSNDDLELRALAVAGMLFPVTYIDFGLSQAFLTHNSGVMMYAFWIAVLHGTLKTHARSRFQQSSGKIP